MLIGAWILAWMGGGVYLVQASFCDGYRCLRWLCHHHH